MKLKKVISVMLVGACVFSMAACGSKKEEAKKIESADDLKMQRSVYRQVQQVISTALMILVMIM